VAGQIWGTAADGGYMYTDELSDVLRMDVQPQVRYRQHCDAKDAMDKGLSAGEAYHWNVYSDTEAQGASITEDEEIPQTKFTITQGDLTVTEYGNSVPYNGKLDDLSYHPVREVIKKVLKNDASKAFDIAARAQFDASVLTVGATAANAIVETSNGTCASINNTALLKAHVKLIVDSMKGKNIPTFASGDYYCIARPSTFRGFKDEIETLHSYVDVGFHMIMNGEIGRYEGVRFVEQTNIAATANFAGNSESDEAHFFGEDTVAEAICIPEEIRGKIPTDYGRSKGIAWYYLGGFGIVHSDTTNARILRWTSSIS